MVSDEFGIDLREAQGGGLRGTFAMAGSFAIGGTLPVLPYVFPIPLSVAVWIALLFAALALFGIGFFAAHNTKRAAGRYIPPLFGHNAISVGG